MTDNRLIGTTPWQRDWFRFDKPVWPYRGTSTVLEAPPPPSRPLGFAFPEATRRQEGEAVQRAFDWR